MYVETCMCENKTLHIYLPEMFEQMSEWWAKRQVWNQPKTPLELNTQTKATSINCFNNSQIENAATMENIYYTTTIGTAVLFIGIANS